MKSMKSDMWIVSYIIIAEIIIRYCNFYFPFKKMIFFFKLILILKLGCCKIIESKSKRQKKIGDQSLVLRVIGHGEIRNTDQFYYSSYLSNQIQINKKNPNSNKKTPIFRFKCRKYRYRQRKEVKKLELGRRNKIIIIVHKP